MSIELILQVHLLVSFIALGAGLVAMRGLFVPQHRIWSIVFLVSAVLVTVTGFMFPITIITPAVGTGIVASLVFVVLGVAHFAFARHGKWAGVYTGTYIASYYLIVFVAVAQAFQKIMFLNELAPTPEAPLFGVVQLVVLVAFIALGWRAIRLRRDAVQVVD